MLNTHVHPGGLVGPAQGKGETVPFHVLAKPATGAKAKCRPVCVGRGLTETMRAPLGALTLCQRLKWLARTCSWAVEGSDLQRPARGWGRKEAGQGSGRYLIGQPGHCL